MAYVLFSLLIGVNLLVWNETHINYPFIFGMKIHLATLLLVLNVFVTRIGRQNNDRRAEIFRGKL